MRRIVALALASSMFISSAPLFAARAAQGQTASLAGAAKGPKGETLANAKVQLRDVNSGQLVGTTTSNAIGAFTFGGLAAGTYAIEVLSATGQIIGTSAAVSVAAGAAVTGVTVSATAAGVAAGAAAGGAAAAGTAAAGAGISTAVVVTTVAVAAGVAATVAVVKANASPSR